MKGNRNPQKMQQLATLGVCLNLHQGREPLELDGLPSETPSLAFAQERTWFLEQAYPQHPVNTVPLGVHLSGPLDHDLLDRAIVEVLRRHQVLRCAFIAAPGAPVPHLGPVPVSVVSVDDLGELPEDEREPASRRWLSDAAGESLDLARGPLWRARLLRVSREEHILLLVGHQMVCDAQSHDILLQELTALYEAFSEGQVSPLEEPAVTFMDFVAWQRRNESMAPLLSHWKQRLAGAPPMLDLPVDHPRPPVQVFRGAKAVFSLPEILVESLRALGQRAGIDLDAVLLAGLAVLLHRYSAQADIPIGLHTSYREGPRWPGVVGPLENTLIIRCELSGDPGAADLLCRVRERLQEAREHADLAFEELIRTFQPGRHLGHVPLYQVMFAYHDAPPAIRHAGALSLRSFEVDNGVSSGDLSLSLRRAESALTGSLIYDPALFAPATIERMLGHYRTLLEALVASRERPISELRLLTDAERHQLLVAWNDTRAEYPEDSSLAALFEAQVEKTPDAVAVLSRSEQLSYRELDRRANCLARYLSRLGGVRETLVGACMERSLDLFIAVLGILKAGGCYVPLDPGYPTERLRCMVEDTGIRVLLTKERWVATLPRHEAQVVCVDTDWAAIAREDDRPTAGGATVDNLAYVVFTSGSTGRPKGVAVEQRQLLNRFAWMWREYPFQADEVCSLKTSLNFVDSLWELLGPLLQGIPTAVIPEAVMRDPRELVKMLAEYRVTRIMLVPSLLRMMLDAHADLQDRLPHLQVWCIGGEPLTVELSRRFEACLPGRRLLNLYGLSEAFDACFFDAGRLAADDTLVPIGRPIANVQAYVLDAHLQPVPAGITGELYVGGAGLARGYVNRQDLTAEKFLPNPFSDQPGARIYRTGDLARFRPDGTIEYLGRIDHQVKIRGFRIEPDEIGTLLRSYPGVRQAMVVAREDGAGDTGLVAYFVPAGDSGPGLAELHGFLRERLPDYMVPTSYVSLSALPLTPSGKVDRLALPASEGRRPDLKTPYIAPRDDVELAITEVWQKVLKVDRVGTNDNFFDLGGNSILIVQVNQQLREILHRDIAIIQMYQYPTVGTLARSLVQVEDESSSAQEGKSRAEIRRGMMNRRRRAGQPSPP